MSEKPVSTKVTVAESFERSKNVACKIKVEHCLKKVASSEISTKKCEEITNKVTKNEAQETKFTKDDKYDKEISVKASEDTVVKDIRLVEAPEVREMLKEEYSKDIRDVKLEKCEIPKMDSKTHKTLKTESVKNVKDDKSIIPTKENTEENYDKNIILSEAPEIKAVNEASKEEPSKDIKTSNIKFFADIPELIEMMKDTLKTGSVEDINNECSKIHFRDFKKSTVKDPKSAEDANKTKKVPVLRKDLLNPWDLGVRKIWQPISNPNLNERPLILATHLAPSLPIELFEVFAEIIEVVTKKPVVLLYESRFGRPVAKDVTDIAILPAANDWNDGTLLPVSFVFEHHLNKNNSPHIYVDVIVENNRASHVENIMDLRGYRCAIPNRCDKMCATSLLFNYLHTKGENAAFFGNILDGNSQLEVLQMVAKKQVEVGVLEAPIIKCHKLTVMGAEFLQILASLGPLPPYRIMINKAQVHTLSKELTTYLLNINQHKEWMSRLSTFGIIGFAENSTDFYNLDDIKSVATSVPYY